MDEEKDLAQEKKEIAREEYELEVLALNKDSAPFEVSSVVRSEYEQEEHFFKTYEIYIPFKEGSVLIATINEEGKLVPNESLLEDERFNEDEKKMLEDMMNRLAVQKENVDLDMIEEQLGMAKQKLQENDEMDNKEHEQEERIQNNEENEEREDSENEVAQEPEANEDINKQEVAKKYHVDAKNVIHIDPRHKKITEDKTFERLANWAEGRNDLYIIVNGDNDEKRGSIQTIVEKKGKEYSEVENNMQQVQGNTPNVDIHVIDKDNNIQTKRPLKLYKMNNNDAMAVVDKGWGEFETVYCRKVDGREEFFGKVVPEMSGNKNVEQGAPEGRAFLDKKNNSDLDLARKADELKVADDHDRRGVPSEKEKVQTDDIKGTPDQNRQQEKEAIKEQLYEALGLGDKLKLGSMPGLFAYTKYRLEEEIEEKAEKILNLLDANPDMDYEEAVQQAAEEIKREDSGREEGGRTPGDRDMEKHTGW